MKEQVRYLAKMAPTYAQYYSTIQVCVLYKYGKSGFLYYCLGRS